ncbi:hypothetical protein SAMN02745247_01129 [Butyrivibrio hungatei DSM 14810]|uniref:Uncharacterized protein n=1 Tax=Butyrivibrio hungatei DSM 14810 TaxID=1121132 RepID=A0A1M7S6C6_9FIRM|nr:DUF6033 family protein [Butyrivibrio hungatei]SHN53990.1 hypothetical protein SAMN02745247_01129 [Butyrivibrio hungatei DSM 14810]
MSKIGGYTSFDVGFQKNIYEKPKSENKRTDKKPVEKYGAAQQLTSKQPELSQGAKDLLNEMQKKYGDMDFFVADYSSDDEAQRYLSRGSKDYSVLIEPELLEKMAADESVKEKYLGIIDDAKNKISEVKDEIAKQDDTEDGVKKSDIKNIGFSVKSDGSVSFFAELEKSSADQKKRIEQAREDKKARKKEDEKEAKAKKLKQQQEDKVKRSVVRGGSADELIKNIREVDWDKVVEEVKPRAGGKINFGV